MKSQAFIFSALFITGALLPFPEFVLHPQQESGPKPRHLEEIAYDHHRHVLYLFGGAELNDKTWTEPDDLFDFNSGWSKHTETGPHARRGHAMIYDEASKVLVVIGGVAKTNREMDSVLHDTWSWSDDNWKLVDAKCPLKEFRAVYNADRKSVLLYGDSHNLNQAWTGGDRRDFELWELRNQQWTKLSDAGPKNGPLPLSYNTKTKSLVALEWQENALIVWEWKKEKWHQTTFDSHFPPARGKYAIAYSKKENALFLFGGTDSKRNLLGDFWKLQDGRWTRLETSTAPSERASLRLVDANDRLLLYGGLKEGGLTNELWEFRSGKWKKL